MVWNRTPWNFEPWADLQRVQSQVNRLFEDFARPLTRTEYPPVNVYTGPDGARLTAELPGVAADTLDVSVHGDTLTLRGERPAEQLGENAAYHRRERSYGKFVRTVQLPFSVAGDEVRATFENGVLDVELPRRRDERSRKINVETGAR